MKKTKKVLRNGEIHHYDLAVFRWRRKMRSFQQTRRKILLLLFSAMDEDTARVDAWLKKPHPSLGNATPRSFMNPKQVKALYAFVRDFIASTKGTP